MCFETRVAVVTGGGRGIGRGITMALADQRFALVINYRSNEGAAVEACHEAEKRGAQSAIAICADMADLEQGQGLLDETIKAHGRVDLWVNNAGVAPRNRSDLLETTPESWDHVLATNLRGPFFLTQAVARKMIELNAAGTIRSEVRDQNRLISLSSPTRVIRTTPGNLTRIFSARGP